MNRRLKQWIGRGGGGITLLILPLFAVPVLVYIGRLLLHQPGITFAGDVALIEMATRQAARGAQMLGPYSRFGWSHPGPAWFLFLAVPYRLVGFQSWSIVVAAALFHVLVGAALLWLCWRQGGRRLVVLTAFFLVVYIRSVDVNLFIYPWNPWALILPMLLLIVVSATDVLRPSTKLLWSAVLGSILVQTHLGTAPIVAGIGISVVGIECLRRRRNPGQRLIAGWNRLRQPRIVLPVAALFVLWVPPLVQQLTHSPGNLGLILRFVRLPDPGHSLSEAMKAVGSQLRRFPFERGRLVNDPVPSHATDGLVLLFYLAVSILLIALGRRRGEQFVARLGMSTGLGLVISVISVMRVSGGIFDFLTAWISVLPVALWLGLGHLLARKVRRKSLTQIAGSVMAAVALVLAVEMTRPLATGPLKTPEWGPTRAAWAATQAALPRYRTEILLRIGTQDRWSMATGLVNQLTKHGWRVAVTDDWLFMFGDAHRRSGRESLELLVVASTPGAVSAPGGRLLGDFGGTMVALSPVRSGTGR
ncbi:MAG: hypothetical protein AB1679_06160 [Actinomycetota bacterium]